MTLSPAETDRLLREGVAAMQRHDARAARHAFETVAAAVPPGQPGPWLLIAQACRLDRDDAAELAALDRLLAEQPRHVRGLIMKGDLFDRQGDGRAAQSFYRLALSVAEAGPPPPPALAADLERARQGAARESARYRAHLDETLTRAGLTPGTMSGRVQHALALANGEARLFLQEPSSFYFPGLPQIQFYDPAEFEWAAEIEARTEAIAAELDAVLARRGDFDPYVTNDPNRPGKTHRLVDNPDWGAFHLLRAGPVPGNADQCPQTLAALALAPQPVITGRSPMALFSLLRPGTHIFAHNGMLNTRLICHLPLIVPPGCRLRVGSETRTWERGRLLIFDDSIEHEAWNDSAETRVILLFEIWRPEISADERAALTVLFEAIDAYRGAPPDMDG